jgi:hypothetical protein
MRTDVRDDAPDAVVEEQFHRFVAALGRLKGLELDAVDPGEFLFADTSDRADH